MSLEIFNKDGKALHIGSVISRFLFDQSDDIKMQCNEISITIDPCYADDKYVDIVIYDDSWNELKRTKTLNGL